MVKKFLHTLLFSMLLVLSHQQCVALPVQEPEVYRVFDSGFKERYSGDKYNYEGAKIVNKTRMGSGKYEDYNKRKIKTKEQDNSEGIFINLGPIWWLFIFILVGAVFYLAYVLLSEGGTGIFSTRKNQPIQDYNDINAENIEHADIHALIKQAENDKDYRLAIRYYYLLTLKTLSLKKHIKFEDDKTNAEYLNELHENPFAKGFSYVSYLYNYIWYGKFTVEAPQYHKAKHNFTTLLNQIK